MNKEIFTTVISSYKFEEKEQPTDSIGLFKYYELFVEREDDNGNKVVDINLSLYWYNDDSFSLYTKDGFVSSKLYGGKLNMYNLKLIIESNIPNKFLKEINELY